ncbi:MAG: N4-gp56 family major capsid protein [Eubacteriales bacterium]
MSNSNTTVNTAGTTFSNKTFYDRALLETAKRRLVHASYGQKRSIPRNSGKRVEFRRYELFTPDTNALVLEEGVTPAGQSLAQSKIEAEVKQYGAYVEVSDLLDLTSYDPVLTESTELLGEQFGTVVEWVTRDAMCAGTTFSMQTERQTGFPRRGRQADRYGNPQSRPLAEKGESAHVQRHERRKESQAALYLHLLARRDLRPAGRRTLAGCVQVFGRGADLPGEIGRLFGVVLLRARKRRFFRRAC